MIDAVAVVSGGMDSVTLAYDLWHRQAKLLLVSFDYGQRHRHRELDMASRCATALNVEHLIVDLRTLRGLLGTSALTNDSIDVPDGHYAAETMRTTVVPNRNAIMLSVAVGIAMAHGASEAHTAVHGGDHYIYPDCRPEFIAAINGAAQAASEGAVRVIAPYLDMTKAEIVKRGKALGVPWKDTWSCYRGGDTHCGSCGTCYERREAFVLADVADPTEYLAHPHFPAPRTVL